MLAKPANGWSFKKNWLFFVPAIWLSLMMLGSATFYVVKAADVQAEIVGLGFPEWLRPYLAVAKVIGVGLLWFGRSAQLRHFAYAGFLFNFVLAALAHWHAGDGEMAPAVFAIILLGLAAGQDPRD